MNAYNESLPILPVIMIAFIIVVAIILNFITSRISDQQSTARQARAEKAIASIAEEIYQVKTSRKTTYMPFALHQVLVDASCKSMDLSARRLTVKNVAQLTEFIQSCASVVEGIKAAAARPMTAEERAADRITLIGKLAELEARAIKGQTEIEKTYRVELERYARRVQEQRQQITEDQEKLARLDKA